MDFLTGLFREHIILTGLGGTAIVALLIRVIPKEWFFNTGFQLSDKLCMFMFDALGVTFRGFGRAVSLGGASKFGIKFWNKIEEWFIASIDKFAEGAMKALHARRQHTCFLNHLWLEFRAGLRYNNIEKVDK